MKEPNYAPVYACLYPGLAQVARDHGYALAVHGTLGRDFDLICVPWVANPKGAQATVDAMCEAFAIYQSGAPEVREHGRLVYTICLQFGECFLDLSFTPSVSTGNEHVSVSA